MDNMQLFFEALKKSVELGATDVEQLPDELKAEVASETPPESEG